ncbi:MAG: AI-2E family transporter, partial [Chloroflexi bacterium]|nr:AI-2E family transporter [Chloroflexota bacterium]
MQDGQPAPGTPLTGDGGVVPRFSPPQVRPSTVVVVVFTVLAIAAGLWLLRELSEIVQWLVIALFVAVAINPAVGWLSRHRVPRGLAILLVYLGLILAIAGLGALVIPPLVQQVNALVDAVTAQAQQPGGLDQAVEDLATRYGLGGYIDALREQVRALPGQLSVAAGPLLALAGGVVGSVTAFITILLLTFLLLLDNDRFIAAGLTLFNPAQRPRLRRLLGQAAGAIHGYVNGNLVISLIAGVAAFIAMTILGMPYSVALALIVALFDLIPLVGGILGAAVAVLVALFVNPVTAGLLAVYFLVYQQIENNILQPMVYKRSVSLHPLAIFVAVLVGAQLLGILGALLAIPVAEILRILGAEWLAGRAQETGGTVHGPHD